MDLNLDLEMGKSLGCLYWGILGAVKQTNKFWPKVALKAVSGELNELRKRDWNMCTGHLEDNSACL